MTQALLAPLALAALLAAAPAQSRPPGPASAPPLSAGLIVKANAPMSGPAGASFTLLNAGSSHLTGLSASLSGTARPRSARFEHDCPKALAPRARCVIRARWPQGAAPRGAELWVSYNESPEAVRLSLPF